jgi:hypothetical protein
MYLVSGMRSLFLRIRNKVNKIKSKIKDKMKVFLCNRYRERLRFNLSNYYKISFYHLKFQEGIK